MTLDDRLSRTIPWTLTGGEVIDPLPAQDAMTTGIASASTHIELHFIRL